VGFFGLPTCTSVYLTDNQCCLLANGRYALERNPDVKKLLDSEGLTSLDYQFIEELIAGPKDKTSDLHLTRDVWPYKGRTMDKAFLFEIVANDWNAIDVDKWDYLARDCHATGRLNRFSFERVLRNIKVNTGMICHTFPRLIG
jgi:hypothetical protein